MLQLTDKTPFNNKSSRKAARLGYKYDEKIHVHYQILNGVSGFLLYYYSFQEFNKNKCPSKNRRKDFLHFVNYTFDS